jgi:hypothetical protein
MLTANFAVRRLAGSRSDDSTSLLYTEHEKRGGAGRGTRFALNSNQPVGGAREAR